ncbi:MAG: DUF896 domain-containing protein [Phascolarctobacterium sp.]|nr:DUF896 domain-containing protein [Phascolarctobacterium sp.]
MEIDELISRINELAHKKHDSRLTPDEENEQKELYSIYLDNIRIQLKNQLDNIKIAERETPGNDEKN